MFNNIGKTLIILGVLIALVGVVIMLFSRFKIPYLGRLPGDILIQRKNFVFYFPLTTSILISLVISIILYFFSRR